MAIAALIKAAKAVVPVLGRLLPGAAEPLISTGGRGEPMGLGEQISVGVGLTDACGLGEPLGWGIGLGETQIGGLGEQVSRGVGLTVGCGLGVPDGEGVGLGETQICWSPNIASEVELLTIVTFWLEAVVTRQPLGTCSSTAYLPGAKSLMTILPSLLVTCSVQVPSTTTTELSCAALAVTSGDGIGEDAPPVGRGPQTLNFTPWRPSSPLSRLPFPL